VDFSVTDGEGEFQEEVRGFMDRYVTEAVLDRCHHTGTMHDWTLHRALGAQGWLGLSWPAEVGGQDRSPMEAALFYEEANRALAPLYGLNTTMVAARAVLACGADHLHAEVLPRVLRGEIIICLGFSEPDSGSDVAAARTRARRDGDVWIVNGQKVFTSVAEEAEFVLLLVRTDPDVPKHQGLTVLLVPMSSEGIEITPIMTLGERTNMTYYRDVVVPDKYRVGEVNGGWDVMTRALSFERGGHGFQGRLIRLLEDVLRSLHALEAEGEQLRDDRADESLGRFATTIEVAKLLDYRTAWLAACGRPTGVEGSMAKLFASEAFTEASSEFMDLLGPYGLLQRGDPGAPAGGAVEYAHRFATPTTVYGGASEVQRSIIAERGLGLPRSR
jgi:alkylation response protein AidB-like acyl-CoA dehydrogenase